MSAAAVGTSTARRLALLLLFELRELAASRSFWFLLIVTGAMVGHAFLDSTAFYAEASGIAGGPAALAQGLSPFEGIVVPTLGAYDVATTLLLPFVVIRVFAADRHSGSLTLTRQLPSAWPALVGIKSAALLIGWLATAIPGAVALLIWSIRGGHLSGAELATVGLGHLLRAFLTIGLGAAAAAIAASAASAAIVALSVTLGAWALDYVAAAQGGVVKELARYTPSAALRVFEHGELRLATVLVLLLLGLTGVTLAAIWMRVGLPLARRLRDAVLLVIVAVLLVVSSSHLRQGIDVSENRRNSFPLAAETALRRIQEPLHITVNLAAQDPRLEDFEREALAKLERVMPRLEVSFVSKGRSGLFERPEDHYGEIWYELNGKRAMARGVSEAVVLETILGLAGVSSWPRDDSAPYPGHPLLLRFDRTWPMFFVVWPVFVAAVWWVVRRPHDRIDAVFSALGA